MTGADESYGVFRVEIVSRSADMGKFLVDRAV
jgi:hypothetical protein